jgi:hypothetical protein
MRTGKAEPEQSPKAPGQTGTALADPDPFLFDEQDKDPLHIDFREHSGFFSYPKQTILHGKKDSPCTSPG